MRDRALIVTAVTLQAFRSYETLELDLQPGLVLVVGPNGAGKTNLLEALHVGAQGFSPRTRSEGQMVQFGAEAARVALRGTRAAREIQTDVRLVPGQGKRADLNGGRLRAAEQLRTEFQTLVFTPDRLSVVKGPPAVRRAYFDRALGRLSPARAGLPAEYGAALGQRNAALRRIAAGASSFDALAPWTERVVALAQELTLARGEAVETLNAPFAARASALGLDQAHLVHDSVAPSVADLEERVERDLERGTTGLGPHLEDVGLLAGERDLRAFGSQGEQRIAVLSLLLAEAALIEERRGAPPLLLLDDVLSELDEDRRRGLVEELPAAGQTVVTATFAGALPKGAAPALVVQVSPGRARSADR